MILLRTVMIYMMYPVITMSRNYPLIQTNVRSPYAHLDRLAYRWHFLLSMARRVLTRTIYDRLTEGFREAPGNATHAGKTAGCDRRMAKRGWETGWPKFAWARPIRLIIEEEKTAAKVKAAEIDRGMSQKQKADRDMARDMSVNARTQFGQLLTLNQGTLIRASGTVAHLSIAGVKLAQYLQKKIIADVEAGTLPPGAGLSMLNRISHVMERLISSSHSHLQTHNLFHGEATEILSVAGLPTDLSIAEAERRAEAAMQAIGSFKRGHLTLLSGKQGAKSFSGTVVGDPADDLGADPEDFDQGEDTDTSVHDHQGVDQQPKVDDYDHDEDDREFGNG